MTVENALAQITQKSERDLKGACVDIVCLLNDPEYRPVKSNILKVALEFIPRLPSIVHENDQWYALHYSRALYEAYESLTTRERIATRVVSIIPAALPSDPQLAETMLKEAARAVGIDGVKLNGLTGNEKIGTDQPLSVYVLAQASGPSTDDTDFSFAWRGSSSEEIKYVDGSSQPRDGAKLLEDAGKDRARIERCEGFIGASRAALAWDSPRLALSTAFSARLQSEHAKRAALVAAFK